MDIRKTKSVVGCIILAWVCVTFSSLVTAHEPRDGVAGGAYNVSVGHRVEPGFAGEPNAFDLIIRNTDDTAADIGDIDIDVTIMFLADDSADAKVKKSAALEAELRRDFSQPNRFNIWYLPTKAGAVGFHIKGMIDGNMIDEVFICGGGSQNAAGRSFGCIGEIQRFPAGASMNKSKRDDDDD